MATRNCSKQYSKVGPPWAASRVHSCRLGYAPVMTSATVVSWWPCLASLFRGRGENFVAACKGNYSSYSSNVVCKWLNVYNYRIAGNFRGVKYSFFLCQADLDENFTPRKPTVTHPTQCTLVKQTKFLLTKLTAVQIFTPRKLPATRYSYQSSMHTL